MYRFGLKSERRIDLLHHRIAACQFHRARALIGVCDLKQAQYDTPGERLRIFAIALGDQDAVRALVQNDVSVSLVPKQYSKQPITDEGKPGVITPSQIICTRRKSKFKRRVPRQQIRGISDFFLYRYPALDLWRNVIRIAGDRPPHAAANPFGGSLPSRLAPVYFIRLIEQIHSDTVEIRPPLAADQTVCVLRSAERDGDVATLQPMHEQEASGAGLHRVVVCSKANSHVARAIPKRHALQSENSGNAVLSCHQQVQSAPRHGGIVVVHESTMLQISASHLQSRRMQQVKMFRRVFDDLHSLPGSELFISL